MKILIAKDSSKASKGKSTRTQMVEEIARLNGWEVVTIDLADPEVRKIQGLQFNAAIFDEGEI
ncbi:hypothetical protein PMW_167 [Pseudomonas phage phiPMW]|uniref:Uncharacterized protein n=1 Tax=Pseudomonas phage phiPMW TaxID=1815582 RepID=A0A1S5R1I7_9CAUD|nr:hypothetical protein FDG97_gp183 [Pseudomonas phage phiPMW]ANA49292.1 hypothetical protein PMW_167 [Pseudomonas phage phiPMW]